MINLILAAALLQPCGLPVKPHKHHALPAHTELSCATVTPRELVMCIKDTPEPEPIEMGVYRYYVLTTLNEPDDTDDAPIPSQAGIYPQTSAYGAGGFFIAGGAPPSVVISPPGSERIWTPPTWCHAPELDATGAGSAVTLLLGILAIKRRV